MSPVLLPVQIRDEFSFSCQFNRIILILGNLKFSKKFKFESWYKLCYKISQNVSSSV